MTSLWFVWASKDYTDWKKKIFHEIVAWTVTTTYIGMAQDWKVPATSDAARRIVKIVETVDNATTPTDTVTEYFYPNTGDKYNNVWDNRASLTYM